MNKTGCLYVVATPIGNYKDITLRAIETLQSVDAVICEDIRQGSTLLKKISIEDQNIIILNEHNEETQASDIILQIHKGKSMALISDAGTPVFADPGHYLISQAVDFGIRVIPIPGPSSLMAAFSVLNFNITKYVFGGFLPRDSDERREALYQLKSMRLPVILMDTPYRMTTLLRDVAKVFGKGQPITLACDLTLPKETIYRGTVDSIYKQTNGRKAEFILIIHQ